MSNNSLSHNFDKALKWAKDNYRNNPDGTAPTNWFVIILVIVLICICFGIYIKYFAVWGVPDNSFPYIPFSNPELSSSPPTSVPKVDSSIAKPSNE